MVLKNVSGETRYFTFVPRGYSGPTNIRGRLMNNGDTITLPDNEGPVMSMARKYITAGVMSVVTAPAGVGALGTANQPANGWISLLTAGSTANDVLTIGGLAFKIAPDPGSGVLGTFYVSLNAIWAGAAGAAATSAPKIVTAINANSATTGITADLAIAVGTTQYIPLRSSKNVVANTGLTLVITTQAASNFVVSGATLTAGVAGGVGKQVFEVSRAAVAGDVSLGIMFFPTALNNIGDYTIKVATATGASKAWDGVTVVSGSTIMIDNSGNTDWAATDVISVYATEQ